jgi:hypothetical protein
MVREKRIHGCAIQEKVWQCSHMGRNICAVTGLHDKNDYHPKTKSENCPSTLFDGVPGVPTAAGAARCCPLVAGLGPCPCPGLRNADVDGASRIGVPTVGVPPLCGEREPECWLDAREGPRKGSTGTGSDGGLTSGEGKYAVVRASDWPRTCSAWAGS